MFYTIIISIGLAVFIFLLARLVWRRVPELKSIDISSIPSEQRGSTKSKILEAKFLREHQKTKGKVEKIIGPAKAKLQKTVENMNEKVKSLEKKYRRHEHVEAARTKSIEELFAEAKKFLAEDDYSQAEKDLIEIIARDKKNESAYELLSELYRQNKNYNQAEEVLRYLIKLKSLKFRKNKPVDSLKKEKLEDSEAEMLDTINVDLNLARYYDDLGKIYELMDKKDKALDCYLKANAIEPNSPKFLDKVIDLSIVVGDKGLAKKTYRRLKEINPENAKLEVFKEALEKMS